jgi:hypothetical protein
VISLFGLLFPGLAAVSSLRGIAAGDEISSSWPGRPFMPNTPGYNKLMRERQAQIAAMPSSRDRQVAYVHFAQYALIVPNFTEHGFGLARAPEELTAALKQGILDGLPTATLEKDIGTGFGPQSLFVDRPDLSYRVLHEMHVSVHR